jgi:hypothetical protein
MRRWVLALVVALSLVSVQAAAGATGWSIQPTPNPPGAILSLFDRVSCPTRDACTAVGYYTTPSGSGLPLAERWNGSNWQIEAIPNPAGSSFSVLDSVSCLKQQVCVAAGSQVTGGVTTPLLERWTGSAWQVEAAPVPTGSTASYFEGVSCTSPRACTAVGSYFTSANTALTLVERWNGSQWEIQATPKPAGSTEDQLNDVSCTTERACTAVGFSGGVALVERWNGSKWEIQLTPAPSFLQDVSCTAPGACAAVGPTFSEFWSGFNWQVQPTPIPTTSTDLVGVSCVTTRICTTVGSFSTNASSTLAERWNGSTWAIQATPNFGGSTLGSLLSGVSCATAGACTAVGSYSTSTGSSTLAEGFSTKG